MTVNKTIVLLFLIFISPLFCMEDPSRGKQSGEESQTTEQPSSKRPRHSSVPQEAPGPSTSHAGPVEETELLLSLLPAQESQPSDNQAEEPQQVTRYTPSLFQLVQEKILQEREGYKSEFSTLPEEVQESLKHRTQVTFLKNSPNMNLIFGAKSLNEILDLITQGVDINAQSGEGDTPFNFFIKSGQLPLAHALIDSIPTLDIWTPNKYKETPLMNAITFKDISLIEKILTALQAAKKYTSATKNALKQTPLHLAAHYLNNNAILFKKILENYSDKINSKDKFGKTPLLLAAQYSINPEIIIALVTNGARINEADDNHYTPLMLAIMFNPNPDIITALIKNGADLNQVSFGQTALMLALSQEQINPDIITILIKNKADLSQVNPSGHTPLMLAALFNPNLEIISTLIKNGAIVDQTDSKGRTPLMKIVAKKGSQPEIITTLIENGANPNKEDHTGLTPLMIAFQYNPDPKIIDSLIAGGADPNAENSKHTTPLLMLVATGNPSIITAITAKGVNLNAMHSEGITPLIFAARYNPNPDMIAALINNGALVNKTASWGSTPLMFAAQANKNPAIITTLIANGADIAAVNNQGKSALDYAAQNPNPEVLKLLQQYSAASMERGD